MMTCVWHEVSCHWSCWYTQRLKFRHDWTLSFVQYFNKWPEFIKKKKVIGDYICHKNTENGYEVFHHCKDCAPFWPLGETAEEGEDEDVEKTEEPEKEEPAEPEPPKGNSTVHPSLYSSLTLTAPPGVMFCDLNFNVGMLIFLCCLLFLEY